MVLGTETGGQVEGFPWYQCNYLSSDARRCMWWSASRTLTDAHMRRTGEHWHPLRGGDPFSLRGGRGIA